MPGTKKPHGDSIPLKNLLPNVPRGTLERLKFYAELVVEWNRHLNLTGTKSLQEFLSTQIQDCVSATEYLPRENFWIDIGTGAGLPGIVWAILWEDSDFLLVEKNQKKVSFLHRVISSLKIHNVKISTPSLGNELEITDQENSIPENPSIVSRGTAPPLKILGWASKTKIPWKQWIVFSSEKTHSEFLTGAKKFAMSVESIRYPKSDLVASSGILSIIQRPSISSRQK